MCLLVFGSSVAYSAMSTTMTITGDAIARVEDTIGINNISLRGVENSGLELYSPEYSKNTIKVGFRLDKLTSKVKYRITVSNTSDMDMTITNIINQTNFKIDKLWNNEDKLNRDVKWLNVILVK